MDCFVATLLAMTAVIDTSVQFLDRHRDALTDTDAHGGERQLAAALFQISYII